VIRPIKHYARHRHKFTRVGGLAGEAKRITSVIPEAGVRVYEIHPVAPRTSRLPLGGQKRTRRVLKPGRKPGHDRLEAWKAHREGIERTLYFGRVMKRVERLAEKYSETGDWETALMWVASVRPPAKAVVNNSVTPDSETQGARDTANVGDAVRVTEIPREPSPPPVDYEVFRDTYEDLYRWQSMDERVGTHPVQYNTFFAKDTQSGVAATTTASEECSTCGDFGMMGRPCPECGRKIG